MNQADYTHYPIIDEIDGVADSGSSSDKQTIKIDSSFFGRPDPPPQKLRATKSPFNRPLRNRKRKAAKKARRANRKS